MLVDLHLSISFFRSANVNGIGFLISRSTCLFVVYMKVFAFCILLVSCNLAMIAYYFQVLLVYMSYINIDVKVLKKVLSN